MDNIEELVNCYCDHFSESDRAVWKYIEAHPGQCEQLSIGVMAEKCCVSRTAVMRFAQKLGLHGYGELKVVLKMGRDQTASSDPIDQVCHTYEMIVERMRKKNCDHLFQAMDYAQTIFIFGEGMVQTSVKKEFKRIFMSAGHMFFDVPSGQELFNVLPMIKKNDFCIMISVSGENKKMVAMADKLRVQGILLLSITKKKENNLAHLCDYQLYVESAGTVETPIHWQYETTTTYFILIDILFLKYLDYKQRKGD